MDRGLTRAVQGFVDALAPNLISAGAGTGVDDEEARQLTLLDAFNLCIAFIDVDDRHTDDELWALVAAFAQHGHLAGVSTPESLRANSVVIGKKAWLAKPSDLFETLRRADEVKGT